MTAEELATSLGFDNFAEMNRLIAEVDISTPAKLGAFMIWRESDGTKAGILELSFDMTAHNMRYLGVFGEQYKRHGELMTMKMNEWPAGLQQYVAAKVRQVGFSGDVVSCAVADWLKTQS